MKADKQTIALVALIEMTELMEAAGAAVNAGEYGAAAKALAGMLDIGEAVTAGLVVMEAKRLGIRVEDVCDCGNCRPPPPEENEKDASAYN